MKLREFIGKITGGAAVQEIVPCNQNLLYPRFSVARERLCLHFIGHTTAILADGLLIGVPEVYLQAAYPQGEILGYQNLKYSPAFAGTDFTRTVLLHNRTPEERARRKDAMVRLEALGDAVLEAWDRGGAAESLAGLLADYHKMLAEVLEPEQAAAYARLLRAE